jgi:hypothetical protein
MKKGMLDQINQDANRRLPETKVYEGTPSPFFAPATLAPVN